MTNFLIHAFSPSILTKLEQKTSFSFAHATSTKIETEIASHVTPIFYRQKKKTWTREGRNLAGRISRNSAGSPPFVPAPLGLFLRADETRYYGCVSRFIPVSISRLADKRPATLLPPPLLRSLEIRKRVWRLSTGVSDFTVRHTRVISRRIKIHSSGWSKSERNSIHRRSHRPSPLFFFPSYEIMDSFSTNVSHVWRLNIDTGNESGNADDDA